MLFVGSCFAARVGSAVVEDGLQATVNPFGTMYNPISVLHTVERVMKERSSTEGLVTVISLGTNHVYIERSTGQVVDNCQKRPTALFEERELSVGECCEALHRIAEIVPGRLVITVSPIRYRKYGFHGSQLSKATLLLAVDQFLKEQGDESSAMYFPAYEILNDELRDYRFYAPEMLHPSEQASKYIYERFAEVYFADNTKEFVEKWRPIQRALNHRPNDPDSEEYKAFRENALAQARALREEFKVSF